MNVGTHRRLKERAKLVGVPIGLMIENLLASLECRLQALLEIAKISAYRLSDDDMFKLIDAIWRSDQAGSISKEAREMAMEIRKKHCDREVDEFEYEPKISYIWNFGAGPVIEDVDD